MSPQDFAGTYLDLKTALLKNNFVKKDQQYPSLFGRSAWTGA